jgi:hypothetical protein
VGPACQHRYKRKIKKKKRGGVLGLKVFSDSLRSWDVRAGLGPTSFSSLFLLFFMLPLADSLGPHVSAFSLSLTTRSHLSAVVDLVRQHSDPVPLVLFP